MIFIILSIALQDPLNNASFLDSLNRVFSPRFIEKQLKMYGIHPDHRKYFGPYHKIRGGGIQGQSSIQSLRKLRANGYDTVRVAAIRVEFLEDTTSLTTGNGRFNLVGSGDVCDTTYDTTGVIVDTLIGRNIAYDPPHDLTYFNRLMEFLHNYYYKVSYGHMWIEWDVLPSAGDSGYSLPHEMKYYGDPENFVIGFFKLLRDAVIVADNDADFSNYDIVIVFHAGSAWQTDVEGDSPYDLVGAQGSGMHELFNSYLIVDGDTIDSGILMPETVFQDGVISFLQGTLCHEFGHSKVLKFVDLYDIYYEKLGMGGWALMGSGNWNLLGLIPPRLCAYNRIKASFDEPVLIDSTAFNLPIKWAGSIDSTTPRIYKVPINSDEYFLIENKNAYVNPDTFHYVLPCTTNIDSNGYRVWKDNVLVDVDDYESSLPAEYNRGGLAIWHIDERKIEATDSLNMINVGYPMGVDLEEADGIQDFEKPLNLIQNIDAAFYGSRLDVFSAEGFNTKFTWETDPSSHDNFGNWSGISITNISYPDTIMYFDISFERSFAGFPKKIGGKMDVISPQNVDSSVYVGDMWGAIYRVNPDDTVFRMIDTIYDDSTYTSPLISDITGDGNLEVFDMTIGGKVFLYSLAFDSLLDSFSINEPIYGNASAADIIPGAGKEILFGSAASELHVLRWDGDSLLEAEGFPLYVGDWLVATPLVIGNSIYVLPGDGTLLKVSAAGGIIWRRGEESASYTLSSPVAGDIDRDGVKEILCSTGAKKIFTVDTAGNIEWERELPAKTYFSTPALGDISGDGYLDIVFADSANIFALNRNGVLIDNFPIRVHLSRQTQSSIVLADVSGDSLLDIVFGSPDGGVFAYNSQGSKIKEFPFATGKRSYSTPLVFDMNGDNRTDLFIGSDDGWLYGWETNGFFRQDGWNRIYLNNDHQSVFPDSLLSLSVEVGNDLTIEEFYIYPSPVRGSEEAFIRFRLGASSDNVVIKVFSLSGRLITEKRVTGHFGPNDVRIDRDLSREANGIYMVTINVEDKVFDKFKFGLIKRF